MSNGIFIPACWPNKLRHVSPSSPHFLALISPQNRLARFSVRVTSASSAKKQLVFSLLLSLSTTTDCVHSRQFTMEPIWSLALFCLVHYCWRSLSISLFSAPLELRLLKPQKMMNNSSPPPHFLVPFLLGLNPSLFP